MLAAPVDLLPAILGAQTYSTAIQRVQATREGMTREEAWQEIGRAVVESAWALLVAPELYLCLSVWWRIQRLSEDLEVARAKRNEASELVSAAKIDPFLYGKDGPFADIAPGRLRGYSAVEDTITRKEGALERAEERLQTAIHRYQRTLEDVATMTPQQQAARLMRLAHREGQLEVARALLTFKAEGGDPANAATDAELRAELETLRVQQA